MSAPSLTEREIRSLPETELYRYAATVWPTFRVVYLTAPESPVDPPIRDPLTGEPGALFGAQYKVDGKLWEISTFVPRGNRMAQAQAETATLHAVREALCQYLGRN